MKKTIYLGYYDESGIRSVSPAGRTVMDYVIKCFEKIKQNSVVVSAAISAKGTFLPREVRTISPHVQLIHVASSKRIDRKNILFRLWNRWQRKKTLYLELLSQLTDGDTLLVYHSLAYMDVVRRVVRKRKVRLGIQVCELYSDVIGSAKTRKKELRFFKIADFYICQTEQINDLVNVLKKPYAILHGTYNCEKTNYRCETQDSIIHCLYAGTLDLRKGGAFCAVQAAKHLPASYHVHILGFGSSQEIAEIEKQIQISNEQSAAKITFHGCLSGKEYLTFLHNCSIGLCTQNPSAPFNDTSFPSKILTYIANGLQVVACRTSVIEKSNVGDLLYYYDVQDAKEIAKTIQSVDSFDSNDGLNRIEMLDKLFADSLKGLL